MELAGGISNTLLNLGSSRVETINENVVRLTVWETIISSDWPSMVLLCDIRSFLVSPLLVDLFDRFQILSGGRVFNFNIFIETKFIPHREQLIGNDVVHLSINVSHITTEWSHDVVSSLLVKIFLHIFVEALYKFVEFVSGLIFL